MVKKFFLVLSCFLFVSIFACENHANNYPDLWWQEVPTDQVKPWEVPPQAGVKGQSVVLSKRHELGVFSNLAESIFTLDGETYGSIEGLWQMMKYPDPQDLTDPRHLLSGHTLTRDQVKKLAGFEAKRAGDFANEINQKAGIDWISYKGIRFNYKDLNEGSEFHFQLMVRAMRQKVNQNTDIKFLLKKTSGLRLMADHRIDAKSPQAYFYHDIYMAIRSEL